MLRKCLAQGTAKPTGSNPRRGAPCRALTRATVYPPCGALAGAPRLARQPASPPARQHLIIEAPKIKAKKRLVDIIGQRSVGHAQPEMQALIGRGASSAVR